MDIDITERLLSAIIGAGKHPKSIRTIEDAIATALSLHKDAGTYAAAAICILYLSHYKYGFPISKLRTFYTNIKEETTLPLFDCKAYNGILQAMSDRQPDNFELMDDRCNIRETQLTKAEIFEALDFYTNQ